MRGRGARTRPQQRARPDTAERGQVCGLNALAQGVLQDEVAGAMTVAAIMNTAGSLADVPIFLLNDLELDDGNVDLWDGDVDLPLKCMNSVACPLQSASGRTQSSQAPESSAASSGTRLCAPASPCSGPACFGMLNEEVHPKFTGQVLGAK